MNTDNCRIELVQTKAQYEGLRALWHEVFGDEPFYVDNMYRAFGDDIAGFIITNDEGKVISALTCYKCGTYRIPESLREELGWEEEDASGKSDAFSAAELDGRPVYVSYAICTDPSYRGLGLAGRLTSYVRDLVILEYDGISIVSPAERSLEDFYSELGYKQHFFANHGIAFSGPDAGDDELMELAFDDDDDVMIWGEDFGPEADIDGEDNGPFDPGINMTPVSAAMYNRYREAFLAETAHIELSERMIDFVKSESLEGDGLFVINGGDAIAAVQGEPAEEGGQPSQLALTELLVNPVLADFSYEIDIQIASMIAGYFGLERLPYRTPGYGRCQSMLAAGTAGPEDQPAYFGFPID
ncbi:MAG: hypothetical protein IKE85_10475 [Mogibacterium sp.]|nr:hypothetical protein [Mogibacterium sp.]